MFQWRKINKYSVVYRWHFDATRMVMTKYWKKNLWTRKEMKLAEITFWRFSLDLLLSHCHFFEETNPTIFSSTLQTPNPATLPLSLYLVVWMFLCVSVCGLGWSRGCSYMCVWSCVRVSFVRESECLHLRVSVGVQWERVSTCTFVSPSQAAFSVEGLIEKLNKIGYFHYL